MGLMIIPTLSIFVLVIFELSFPLIFANAMFYQYNLNVFLQDCFLRKKIMKSRRKLQQCN